jgi:NADH:ubiquinone oxidoreductase subunit E
MEVSSAFSKALTKHGLNDEIQIVHTGCLGPCAIGPVVVIYPDAISIRE